MKRMIAGGIIFLLGVVLMMISFFQVDSMYIYVSLIREAGYTGLSPITLCSIMLISGVLVATGIWIMLKIK